MAKQLTSKKATKPKAAKAKTAPAQAKTTTMTLEEVMRQLKALGNEAVRAQNSKSGPLGSGAGDNQFGVSRGDVRKLANKIKTNHELALALWKTGNIDAQFLAALLVKVDLLSADEMERMVKSVTWMWVADWLYSYVLKEHADKETLRKKWMTSDDRWTARAGWQLTAGRVAKSPEGLDLEALLDRIEKEMGAAASRSAMDDEHVPCGNRHPLPQTPQAGDRDRLKSWGSIATILVPKDARRHSPRSGSTKW